MKSTNHRTTVNNHRDDIINWFSKGATNNEVADRLEISVAALHRHTIHWKIKKITKRRERQKRREFEPVLNKIKHLAVNAKWIKTAL
tara:strand:- start:47 stop:307 length:261 start_codon:yes stop_codon:yes gene_type:complete